VNTLDRSSRNELIARLLATHADTDLGPSAELDLDASALRDDFGKRVRYQDDAVEIVANRLIGARAGLRLRPERPLATFLFVGPTGVGKTELGRAIAESFFDDQNALIRLDMSEYAGEWATAGIIGAKPGYIGHDNVTGCLTTKVMHRPQSVVLFDEIEKADPSVWNLLLQILDAGRLTDSRGQEVSFAESVVVLTSNCGARDAARPSMGFGALQRDRNTEIRKAIERTFSPEFIGRCGDIITFDPLSRQALSDIARIELHRVGLEQQAQGRTITVSDAVIERLVDQADPAYGARSVQNELERLLFGLAPLLDPDHTHYQATLYENSAEICWETYDSSC
jgi:ATP-dependent Clp protease ATP-binding subunit ClpC